MCTTIEFALAKEKILCTVWELVSNKYVLLKERGVDWNKILIEYKIRVNKIDSYEELYSLIDNMLLELDDPHTRVIFTPYTIVRGIIPLLITCIDNVFYVNKNLYGGKLSEGMRILSINGVSIEEWMCTFVQKYRFKSISHINSLFIKHFNEGKIGHNLKIKAVLGDRFIDEDVKFLDFSNQKSLFLEENMKQNLRICQFQQVEANIGYLHIITFRSKNVIKEFNELTAQLKSIKYLVIDIRGNDGGLIEVASKMAGAFIKKDTFLGYQVRRKNAKMVQEFDLPSEIRIPSYYELYNLKKIIVISDEFTMSSAEFIFLRALKLNDEVVVIGNKTGGLAHGASVFTLFDGSKIQITTSKYLETNKEVVKEDGIEPNIYVEKDIDCFTDKQLAYALDICK